LLGLLGSFLGSPLFFLPIPRTPGVVLLIRRKNILSSWAWVCTCLGCRKFLLSHWSGTLLFLWW
jgi:hypothetical protein